MADIKSVPSPIGQVFIVPSAPLPAGIVVPGVGTPPAATDRKESKLPLEEDELKFLESEYNKFFMTEFKVGSIGKTMYGNPVRMSLGSDLIEGYLGPMVKDKTEQSSASSAPKAVENVSYVVGDNVFMMQNPLIVLWLWMNGVGYISRLMSKLSFDEFINMYDLLNYFGIRGSKSEKEDESDPEFVWNRLLIITHNRGTPEEVKRNAQSIIKIFDRLAALPRGVSARDYAILLFFHIWSPEVISNTINIPIIMQHRDGELGEVSYIERKKSHDPNALVWALRDSPFRRNVDGTYTSLDAGGADFEMISFPNFLLLKMIGQPLSRDLPTHFTLPVPTEPEGFF